MSSSKLQSPNLGIETFEVGVCLSSAYEDNGLARDVGHGDGRANLGVEINIVAEVVDVEGLVQVGAEKKPPTLSSMVSNLVRTIPSIV